MTRVKQISGSKRAQTVKQLVKQTGNRKNAAGARRANLKLDGGAGDGARTRDDLLGRQAFFH